MTFKKSVESLNIDTENDTSTSTQQITIYTSMEYPVKLEPDSFGNYLSFEICCY